MFEILAVLLCGTPLYLATAFFIYWDVWKRRSKRNRLTSP